MHYYAVGKTRGCSFVNASTTIINENGSSVSRCLLGPEKNRCLYGSAVQDEATAMANAASISESNTGGRDSGSSYHCSSII